MRNIVLIGGRAVGKSATAAALGALTGRAVCSLDAVIESGLNRSIAAFVAAEGWAAFRAHEAQAVADLADAADVIIDCGGGVVAGLDADGDAVFSRTNVENLRRNGVVFWLTAPLAVQQARLGDHRPALTGGRTAAEELAEVMAQRTPWYRSAADHIVDTAGKTPEQAAADIMTLYESEADRA
jgi:shikimate kinase